MAAVLVFGLSVFAKQILVFPFEAKDLPDMENPRVVINKGARTLEVFDGSDLVKTYKIALGSEPKGDKEKEGDGKTPEGEYSIFIKNPKSSYYLSLGISYPNVDDADRGLKSREITKEVYDQIVKASEKGEAPPQKTPLGGEIYIHGNGNLVDWTAGCIAMTNVDIKELFTALPIGTKVVINP